MSLRQLPIPIPLSSAAGATMAGMMQYLVVIGLLVGVFLVGSQILGQSKAVMTISRIKSYDAAVRNFRGLYQALPGDIADPRQRLASCQNLPCAASGNADNVIADRKPLLVTPYYFRDTSENRTFWLHMAVAGLVSGIKSDGTKSANFGQWGIEFPQATLGIPGGYHIAYYSVSPTASNQIALIGHYAILRGSTDTYGIAVAPYALTAKTAAMIDKKIDDGQPFAGRVVSVGSNDCVSGVAYNLVSTERGCNMLFQLSF